MHSFSDRAHDFDSLRARWLVWLLLVGLTVLRLCLAGHLGLTPDEAYYWIWSRTPQASYLDHPFMIALWIRVGTALFGDNAFGVRVLGPVSALLGSVALISAGRDILGSRSAGYRAALILNATLMLGLGAATATPDTPLVFFLALALFSLGRLGRTGKSWWWIVIGLCFGLAFDSKYTAVLPASGCFLWMILTNKHKHKHRQRVFWVFGGGCAGLIAILPVLFWNYAHCWVSFVKQGGRVGDWNPLRALRFLSELVGGQIGLATPLIFFLFCLGIIQACRLARRDEAARLLACLCLVPVVVFVQHAFGGRVQANWPVVLYPAAALAAAATRFRIRFACGLGLALTLVVTFQGLFAPVRLSPHHDVIARQTAGWPGLAHEIEHQLPSGYGLLTTDYALSSILTYTAPALSLFSSDTRWAFLRRPLTISGPVMLLLRDGEQPDLPRSWIGPKMTRPVCRRVGTTPMLCYHLVNLNIPETALFYRLP